MQIRLRLFATYREIVGSRQLAWSVRDGTTAGELVDQVLAKYPRLRAHRDAMLVAVNESFAAPDVGLQDGDEVALMPPVSGGAGRIGIQREAIDVEAVVDSVRRPQAGAVVLFLGTVRSDRGVRAIDYEVYRPMALTQIGRITDEAKAKFGALEIAIVHRLGRIAVGSPSVAIAVSAAHRAEAFAACEWAMDQVKQIVPIWKTETSTRRKRSGGAERPAPSRPGRG
jgi:molybdopterin converting factor subunit 1